MPRIHTGLNPWHPVTIARAPGGELYITNGLDRPQRWDGHDAETEDAGITAPSSGVTAVGAGAGALTGDYRVFVRYLDKNGIPSNFNDDYTEVALATDASVSYTDVPTSGEARVTQRQIWRNTDGQITTYYLDATIADNTTTTASSTKTDTQLEASTAIRYVDEQGWPNADRFGPPPDYMGVAIAHQERMWYIAPVPYTEGSITSLSGTTVEFAGTALTDEMDGRKLFMSGYVAGTIDSITSTLELELEEAPDDGFGTALEQYAIYPAEDKRNSIIFSEIDEAESVAVDEDGVIVNEVIMQEDGDELTGGMTLKGYLYLNKQHHIYRLVTNGNPRQDCIISLAADRGVLNQRCWDGVDGMVFCMDREGPHLFNGQRSEDIGGPVLDYWREKIVWRRHKFFHVQHIPDMACVRFFVCLDGSDRPRHALEFHYEAAKWYEVEYPHPVGHATSVHLLGQRRLIAGSDDQIVALDEGVLDGPAETNTHRSTRFNDWNNGTLRGTTTATNRYWIEDTAGTFTFPTDLEHDNVIGTPVQAFAADGSWQTRRIYKIEDSKIYVQDPFSVLPVVGQTYQIGGIEYLGRFGSLPYIEDTQDNPRDIRVWHKPLSEDSTLNVRRYHNHSSTPQPAAATFDYETGFTTVKDSPNGLVDLETEIGFVVAPQAGHINSPKSDRVVEVELKGVGGQQQIELFGLDIEGVDA